MMKPHLQRAISASTYYQICLLVDHEVRTPQQHQSGKAYPQPPSSSRHLAFRRITCFYGRALAVGIDFHSNKGEHWCFWHYSMILTDFQISTAGILICGSTKTSGFSMVSGCKPSAQLSPPTTKFFAKPDFFRDDINTVSPLFPSFMAMSRDEGWSVSITFQLSVFFDGLSC
nr:hypothetical protein Iba_chr05aCG8800 [Ipomoea batatas]